jgi:hypothetical protein
MLAMTIVSLLLLVGRALIFSEPASSLDGGLQRLKLTLGFYKVARPEAREKWGPTLKPIPSSAQRWSDVVVSTHGIHWVVRWFPRWFSHPSVVFIRKPGDGLVIGRRNQWE